MKLVPKRIIRINLRSFSLGFKLYYNRDCSIWASSLVPRRICKADLALILLNLIRFDNIRLNNHANRPDIILTFGATLSSIQVPKFEGLSSALSVSSCDVKSNWWSPMRLQLIIWSWCQFSWSHRWHTNNHQLEDIDINELKKCTSQKPLHHNFAKSDFHSNSINWSVAFFKKNQQMISAKII